MVAGASTRTAECFPEMRANEVGENVRLVEFWYETGSGGRWKTCSERSFEEQIGVAIAESVVQMKAVKMERRMMLAEK